MEKLKAAAYGINAAALNFLIKFLTCSHIL